MADISIFTSSKSNEWETPQDLFDRLDAQFHFTLDPAATDDNHKCAKWYTMETNGLIQDWSNEVVFCNPPYGKEIGKWVEKCYNEARKHNVKIVMLIPARTDTKWFHKYLYKKEDIGVHIEFLQGRLRFINRTFPSWRPDGNFKVSPANFPSMIVYFNCEDGANAS